ncbi:MAG: insulinase family protein [Treponemataceae bacterium]|nr:insulinase family protein [Treponemataceae bacterium]
MKQKKQISHARLHFTWVGLLLLFLGGACATPGPRHKDFKGPSAQYEAFYTQNQKDFIQQTLPNGIPIIIKGNAPGRVVTVKILIQGGSSVIPLQKAGLEKVGLALLSRGSERYSYEGILDTLYRTSASLSFDSQLDYATYDLTCIDQYLPSLLDIYLDGFLRPLLSQDQFELVCNEALQFLEEEGGDPDRFGRRRGIEALFQGEAYESLPAGTKESLSALTLEDVRQWHRSILNAQRLVIIVVGNVSPQEMLTLFAKNLGNLPQKASAFPSVSYHIGSELRTFSHAASKNVAYIQGFFQLPPRSHPDYVPFAMGIDMLDDLYFNIVREQHGACYSVGTIFNQAKTPYGIIWVYKATDIRGIPRYIEESWNLFKKGNLILMKNPETDTYVYTSLSDRLRAYKNKYINQLFENQKTSAQIGGLIARSLVFTGDPLDYLRFPERIEAVTVGDITRAMNRWLFGAPLQWIVVSDAQGLAQLSGLTFPGKKNRE